MLQLTDRQKELLLTPGKEILKTHVREDVKELYKKGAFPPHGPYIELYASKAFVIVNAGIAERYGRMTNVKGERDERIRGPYRYRLTIPEDDAKHLLDNY